MIGSCLFLSFLLFDCFADDCYKKAANTPQIMETPTTEDWNEKKIKIIEVNNQSYTTYLTNQSPRFHNTILSLIWFDLIRFDLIRHSTLNTQHSTPRRTQPNCYFEQEHKQTRNAYVWYCYYKDVVESLFKLESKI